MSQPPEKVGVRKYSDCNNPLDPQNLCVSTWAHHVTLVWAGQSPHGPTVRGIDLDKPSVEGLVQQLQRWIDS